MRMRKKKNGAQRLDACADYLIKSPQDIAAYSNKMPFSLEIGCGKGKFVCEMAKKYPDKLFFAVEKVTDALIIALERAKAENIPNVRFINCDALVLAEYFDKGSVECLYLNFSDPWPKAKHAKRRLTYRTFLEYYKRFLTNGAKIIQKTDNRALFDFSLEEYAYCGFETEFVSYDLHNDVSADDNIMTEYEKNFSEKGFSINKAVVKVKM